MSEVNNQSNDQSVAWKFSFTYICLIVVSFIFLYLLFKEGILHAVQKWDSPEYSHAYLIPFISLFIIWQKNSEIIKDKFNGSWLGVAILLLGIFFWFLGEVSTLYVIIKYSLLVVLFGVVLSFSGIKRFHYFLVPIFLLFFTIPLPSFIYNNLSAYLQLISSSIGVEVIRLFGISVFLEGNVIDLGNYKLQVVEACNGLRYLFPLVTLGVITAYFYNDSFWKKCVVVISTLPITILMNSIRIGIIGVLVEYWGIAMAEGFLHDFEGWVIFMVCFAILLTEIWLLSKITTGRSLREVLSIDVPGKLDLSNYSINERHIPKPFYASILVLFIVVAAKFSLPERQDNIPDRQEFIDFPAQISNWQSVRKTMEAKFIDALKFEDYLLANYFSDQGALELYIAYYDSQRKGESAHSPRSCLPGAGWKITDRNQIAFNYENTDDSDSEISISRMLVQQGDNKYLMYYWFKQRDRHITNEYLVKWYLFWDGVTSNRTDGALIRIMYPIRQGQDVQEGDQVVQSFLQDTLPILSEFVPD
ncbi:MAG: VPLPA-CTERM-specific exosortase XrtD [Gammaproteobacteria bacterium]|nr:VPLPA-CTERM-specific exosortase XrtD [Gammaproteobacteria bacterium]